MQPVLSARNVSKRFGVVQALNEVSIDLCAGEIHAILGENGAGKSTLVSALSGALQPDSGVISFAGVECAMRSPRVARVLGIALVHQHFALVPAFTVEENFALDSADGGKLLLDSRAAAAPALASAVELGWTLRPDARVSELSVGEQQRIEIIKAILSGSRVILFDEPTATLSRQEVVELFSVMRKLRDEGRTIALIAHKLDEVLEIADKITVLRRGEIVAQDLKPANTSAQELAELMVGQSPPHLAKKKSPTGDAVIVANNISIRSDAGFETVRNVSFEIHRGEIVGFGGVDGNGQKELAEAMAGIRVTQGGASLYVTQGTTTAYIPEDRRRDGLALDMNLSDNLLIRTVGVKSLNWGAFLSPAKISRFSADQIQAFDIRCSGPKALAVTLSGGNQQKLIIAGCFHSKPDLIVAVNPTRGLDIRATNFVRQALLDARNSGAAVALFSTDLEEISEIADRSFVMSGGKLLEGGDVGMMLGGRS